MIRLIPLLILALTLPLAALPAEAAPPAGSIVVLHDGVDAPAVAREHAARHAAAVSHVYTHALTGYAARIPAAALARLQADPRVRFVAADRPIPLTGRTTQKLPTGINRIEADQSSTTSGNGVDSVNVAVAILDSGIQPNHPDLNVVGGVNCSLEAGDSFADGHGHGTHVAGIVGAKDNGVGVVGVAPGTPLYAVRTHDANGNANWSNIICGIGWVTANAATIKVANISAAGAGTDAPSKDDCSNADQGAMQDALHMAICNSVKADVTYVVAAANNASDFATTVPAAYDEVLTVTAITDYDGIPGSKKRSGCLPMDGDDSAANFSNFTTVNSADAEHTIAAPGGCIYSTHKGSSYTTKSGTSMASPHVAGVAALCIASGACADLAPSGIIARLRADAESKSNSSNHGYKDDPNSPNVPRYYGHLVYAGGY